jgi:hypothetical protein
MVSQYKYVGQQGDWIVGDTVSWSWTAAGIFVYTEHGPSHRPELHHVAVQPRAAALFQDYDHHSQEEQLDCNRSMSTDTGNGASYWQHFLSTVFTMRWGASGFTVDSGPPFDHHFAFCGIYHAHGPDRQSMDGLTGPWRYVGVRAPSRNVLRHATYYFYRAYSGSAPQGTHGAPPHNTGGGGSHLYISFEYFKPNQLGSQERRFNRTYPRNSPGFRLVPH